MVYKCFDKEYTSGAIKSNIMSNQQLAKKLQKPIIRKFRKFKVYSSFKDNIWGVDLVDIQLISKYNKEIRFLLCVIDICSKYPCVVTLKDKKVLQLLAVFQKFQMTLIENQTKYGYVKSSRFYNRSVES